MSRFEYLSVLISIVVALGMSEIVVSWGNLLRHRHEVTFYWIHTFASALVMLLLVQFWWGFWVYRELADWSFVALLAIVSEAIVMVLAASVITPSRASTRIDLKAFYFQNVNVFLVLMAILMVLLAVIDATAGNQPVLHLENLIRGAAVALIVGLMLTRSEVVHGAAIVLGFVLLTVFLVVAFNP